MKKLKPNFLFIRVVWKRKKKERKKENEDLY